MYDLPYFKEQDEQVVKQFVRDHPFAFITGCNEQLQPVATQLPVFIDEREGKLFLSGHMMRNTDHHKAFASNPQVLAVFTGKNCYVSASWYDNPQQGSTWNYISVHARGSMRFVGEKELIDVLRRTTTHFENNPNSAAGFDHLPAEYVEKMSKAIVAFEIEVTSMENVFKLSQNRNEKSYDNIITQLKKRGGDSVEIANLMEKRKGKVFK